MERKEKQGEIDQRPNHELMFRCNCGGSHFTSFSWSRWDDMMSFWIEVIDPPHTLGGRIQNALRYIFKGGNLYYCDVGLTASDLVQIKSFIDGYLQALEEGGGKEDNNEL